MSLVTAKHIVPLASLVTGAVLCVKEADNIRSDRKYALQDKKKLQRASAPDGYELYGFHGTSSKFRYSPEKGTICVARDASPALQYAQKYKDPAFVRVYVKAGEEYGLLKGHSYVTTSGDLNYSYCKKVAHQKDGETHIRDAEAIEDDIARPTEVVSDNCSNIEPAAFGPEGHFKFGDVEPLHAQRSLLNGFISAFRRILVS